MHTWLSPQFPFAPPSSHQVRVHSTHQPGEVTLTGRNQGPVRVYACGITPYDATHMGHAATYLMTDTCVRAARDAGEEVLYAQNITDIDDPLLERAARDQIPWQELATAEIELFREDMQALGVVPPQHYLGVVESMEWIVESVEMLVQRGVAYRVPCPDAAGEDVYLDLATASTQNPVSGWDERRRAEVFPERGGDPDRAGKRDPLDPLLWRAERTDEPSWAGGSLGPGRPGWHIECTAIATRVLGETFDVQAGGSDLIFPHHDYSAVQAEHLGQGRPFARAYLHQGMVAWQGEKMSKSKGNLVLVSALRREGIDPQAIRTAVLSHHYRDDWEWTQQVLDDAQRRLTSWRDAVTRAPQWAPLTAHSATSDAPPCVDELRAAVAGDLHTPAALDVLDAWAAGAPTAAETAWMVAVAERALGLTLAPSTAA